MKKIKYLLSLLLFLIIFSLVSKPQVVNADTGPKPSSFITIKGIEGDYVSCFASKKADGPNFTYQDYLEYGYDHPEYNPIMEYEDDEGYKWITNYYICRGESTISFTYFCPSEFKIVIYQNNELLIATEMLEMYAFSTYYEIDFSTGTITTPEDIKVTKTYDYTSEILNLILRIVLTLAIEIGVNLKTVERAYNELINFGLVESIPKKGYFVKDNIDRDKSYAFDIINKLRNDGMKKEVLLCAIEEVYGKENK